MNIKRKYIIPTPLFENRGEKGVKIGRIASSNFEISFASEGLVYASAKEYIIKKLAEKGAITSFGGEYKISFCIDESDERLADKSDESYAISVCENSAKLVSKTDRGAYYAAVTFFQTL